VRQALSAKRTRRYARLTGLPIERMLARGGSNHQILFRTTDDRHGTVRAVPPYDVTWRPGEHWSSCHGRL
jgi:hypothetical protein